MSRAASGADSPRRPPQPSAAAATPPRPWPPPPPRRAALRELSFRYGQRHAGWWRRRTCGEAGVADHVVIDIDLRRFGGSALTADIPVPKDREESEMTASHPAHITWRAALCGLAPSRSWRAEVLDGSRVYTGVNAVDSIRATPTVEDIAAFETMANLAEDGAGRGAAGNRSARHDHDQGDIIRLGRAPLVLRVGDPLLLRALSKGSCCCCGPIRLGPPLRPGDRGGPRRAAHLISARDMGYAVTAGCSSRADARARTAASARKVLCRTPAAACWAAQSRSTSATQFLWAPTGLAAGASSRRPRGGRSPHAGQETRQAGVNTIAKAGAGPRPMVVCGWKASAAAGRGAHRGLSRPGLRSRHRDQRDQARASRRGLGLRESQGRCATGGGGWR